ncbi:MAG TPA: biotin--[acetyl-CoA-carboxylase] ligase [Lacibacter sp.]|nr:biotin--[acetyl-CoA-carboxylase] ligase [Lacibacter sp.]HMO88096.1 biotin--[acetyl-CoA-carboxylase] ligase [Lacibacter sp.]
MSTKNQPAPLLELNSTDSTNNYAMRLVHAGLAQPGGAVLAYAQTAGKGQRGKTWASPPGESLSLSLLLQPTFLLPAQGFQLLAATAAGVRDILSHCCGRDLHIKWMNDLYQGDRKAGGILIENLVNGNRWNWAVVGIGINVNQEAFDPSLPNPVSLRQITGRVTPVRPLAEQLQAAVLQRVQQLETEGFAPLLAIYNQWLYKRDDEVRFRQGSRVFTAVPAEVDAEGLLYTRQGHRFRFGEVEWQPAI